MSAESSLADKYAAGLPCGLLHPPFTFSWSTAAWSEYHLALRRPRRVCTGVPRLWASLALLLRAGASPSGLCCLRFCISRVGLTLTASWTFFRPFSQVRGLRPFCSALCIGLMLCRGFGPCCKSIGLLCPPCPCQPPMLWLVCTAPRNLIVLGQTTQLV